MSIPAFEIRLFRTSDADALANIYVAAVAQLGRGHYTPAQLRVWRARSPSVEAIRDAYQDGRRAFVAVNEYGQVSGFSDLEQNGHIRYLYISPHMAGRGIARKLLVTLEDQARALGLSRIFAEASEVALPVFERAGFLSLQRQNFEIDGIAIHNYAVEKRILDSAKRQSAKATR
ncbi:GNAT family N-acetyltransferase [Roseobacter sp. EG26]|uniref:GNAT family N-acetyltransferase n=1 Tax=Roseobacter sp. EG26 TaxID=3412477 RepID=UPI003CE54822